MITRKENHYQQQYSNSNKSDGMFHFDKKNAGHLKKSAKSLRPENVVMTKSVLADHQQPSLCQSLAKILYNPAQKAKISQAVHLPAEVEQGNHEYKYTLANISQQQMTHRISQLLWRLKESETVNHTGEECDASAYCDTAYYHIGVEDDGNPLGITDCDLKASLQTLEAMAKETECEVRLHDVSKGIVPGTYVATVVFTRKACLTIETKDTIMIALAGQDGCGKTTMIGVLTSNQFDNGRGLARMKVLTHNHEVITGRTSCISHTPLYENTTNDQITETNRMVSLIDLAGHSKYLKTTLTGLVGRKPDYVVVTISCINGIEEMTKEHIAIALYLKVPLIFIMTKIDLLPRLASRNDSFIAGLPQVKKILVELESLMLEMTKRQYFVRAVESKEDVLTAAAMFKTNVAEEVRNSMEETDIESKLVPMLFLSNVTGHGLEMVRQFFFALPNGSTGIIGNNSPSTLSPRGSPSLLNDPCIDATEFASGLNQIRILGSIGRGEEVTTEEEDEEDDGIIDDDDLIEMEDDDHEGVASNASMKNKRRKSQPKQSDCPLEFADFVAVGDAPVAKILIGRVMTGRLQIGAQFYFGPTCQGDFISVIVTTLRVNNIPVQFASDGQIITFCLALVPRSCVSSDNVFHSTNDALNRYPKRKNAAVGTMRTAKRVRLKRRHLAGMVLISSATDSSFYPQSCREFYGELTVINRNSPMRLNFEPVLHTANVRQAVRIIDIEKIFSDSENIEADGIEKKEIGNQQKAVCKFRFVHYPEFLSVGDTFIIREDRSCGVGVIIKLL